MPTEYTVQQGDCISSIAYEHGFFWETLWNDGSNAALKSKRKDPNVLMEGDVVHIPDLSPKEESGATQKKHKFKVKGVPEMLRIRLIDQDDKPRANLDYIILIDGDSRRGKTGGDGQLKERIPPGAKEGKILLGKDQSEVIHLKLGHLNPVSEISGVKARLANLGYYSGTIDENPDDGMKQAIRDFQKTEGLSVTGDLDDATRQKIEDAHGH